MQHYLFCPRQCALIHLEQAWEENLLTVEGDQLHARVDRPESTHREGVHRAFALPIRALALGLVGKADLVCFMADESLPQGRPFPVEYKRGKPKRAPWDRVQLCAQALCLEEMFACAVPDGALYYGTQRKRYPVTFDTPLRDLTKQTIKEVHQLLAQTDLPKAANDKRCKNCSLVDICMPQTPLTLGRYFHEEPTA
uniref:CRISPR-associated exonuclease Cas4 n=1 Tax=Magnetococcus massalia (strain MO-1) TaxID=451514 RepID=A0A1S7LE53_MAGMO|nr:Conserved protein of unknown function. might be involved in the DNA repair. CRISPR-associated exonuclease, Cas4 family [Candidatus Magnetococcus massalia]